MRGGNEKKKKSGTGQVNACNEELRAELEKICKTCGILEEARRL